MKLLLRQRFFSWFDSYDIFDESGETVYRVEGCLSWGHRLEICDAAGTHLATVKEKIFTCLPKFQLYLGDTLLGEIRRELTFLRPRYALDFNGWTVQGDFLAWEYEVHDGTKTVMRASRRLWNLTDTYEIDIDRPENALYSLMIVLAIDAAQCSARNG